MLLAKSLRMLLSVGLVLITVGCGQTGSTPVPVSSAPSLLPPTPTTFPVQNTPMPAATVKFIIDQPPSGNSSAVGSVAFSPDGRDLVSIYENGEIILWDVGTRQPIRSFMGEGVIRGGLGGMTGIAFSPDGKFLVSVSYANGLTITLWDIASGQSLDVERDLGHGKGMALSPDGKLLAYGKCVELDPWSHCSQYDIILWDVATRQPIGQLPGFRVGAPAPLGLLFSPDGRMLAAMSSGVTGSGIIQLFDVTTRQLLATPLGGEEQFASMAFSPDGKYMALGSIVGVIYIWDPKQHHIVTELIGERGFVTSVAFSPGGKTLASQTLVPPVDPLPREKIVLWDMDTLQTIGQPLTGRDATGGDSGLISMAFSPDDRTLASGTDDGAIILWDLTRGSHGP